MKENQTFTALNGLNVQRRVIITGTPIQVHYRYIRFSLSVSNILDIVERSYRVLLSTRFREPWLSWNET